MQQTCNFQKTHRAPLRKTGVREKVKVLKFTQNTITVQEMKFPIKDFFSKCDQICRKLRIWLHLLKKSLMENFIFCVVHANTNCIRKTIQRAIKCLNDPFKNIINYQGKHLHVMNLSY